MKYTIKLNDGLLIQCSSWGFHITPEAGQVLNYVKDGKISECAINKDKEMGLIPAHNVYSITINNQ